MASRVSLQEQLEELLGSRNVYFQPPETVKLKYPCIIYNLDDIQALHADNFPYRNMRRYQLMYIDRNPDNSLLDRLAALKLCRFSRFYTAENLNHYIYQIFY